MKTLRPLLIAVFTSVSSFAQFSSDMNFTDIYGNTINPTSILNEGKHIYLDFFSTSCGACNSLASEVANAYEYYGANNGNVFFLGVDYNSSTSACLNFANQHNTDFPIISGQQEGIDIFNLFEQSGYPSGRLINPSGGSEAIFSYSQIANLTESLATFISPVENCDFIEIQSMEINNQTGGLVLDIFTSTSFGPYPYFILTNTNGDNLAQEQIYYFGLSEATTHNLQLLTDPSSWDSNLILELYEGMGDNLECTFEISVGCTNYLATNYIPNANLDDGSCNYASCDALGFELLESQISFTESQFGGAYSLNIPMENNSSNWLAYPMSETIILNPLDGMICENCDFNVIGNPWGLGEILTSNIELNFNSAIPENYEIEAHVYLSNLSNNGQEFESCQFDQLISYNLNPISLGCTDDEAVNFDPEAVQDDGSCLYTSNNCGDISININGGWNLVGFSCNENIDAEIALNPYLNRLIIAKDYLGAAYLPEWNFNGIGTLERGFGYQIKISEAINEFNLCNP